MNSKALTIAVLTAAGAVATAVAKPQSQLELDIDKRDPNVAYLESSESFLKSWHSNEVYLSKAEYSFDAELKLSQNKSEQNWMKMALVGWVPRAFDMIQKGHFEGKAITCTIVYHEFPHLSFIRDYDHVYGDGDWFAETAVASDTLRNWIVEAKKTATEPDRRLKTRKVIYECLKMIPSFGTAVAETTDAILKWGENAWDVSETWGGKYIGKMDDDGILKISADSIIGKIAMGGNEGAKVMAMAKQFSKDINERKIALCYNGTDAFDASEIQNVPDPKNPQRSYDDFFELVMNGNEIKSDDPLYPVLSRESMTPAKDLFDGSVRKIGDQWAVDAGVFNSFLHPDLKGCFKGTAVLEYVEDTTYRSMVSKEVSKDYAVRKLRVVPKGKIDGRMVETKLVYDERENAEDGRFYAEYDSNSELFVYVDKKSGHVILARAAVRATNCEALPKLKLLRGVMGNGNAVLEIKFEADVLAQAQSRFQPHGQLPARR